LAESIPFWGLSTAGLVTGTLIYLCSVPAQLTHWSEQRDNREQQLRLAVQVLHRAADACQGASASGAERWAQIRESLLEAVGDYEEAADGLFDPGQYEIPMQE